MLPFYSEATFPQSLVPFVQFFIIIHVRPCKEVHEKNVHQQNLNHIPVWQILKDQQLYPYNTLLPGDLPLRIGFCSWLREKIIVIQNFLNRVLFKDEACFSRLIIFNSLYNHVCSDDAIIKNNTQQELSVNIRIEIISEQLIGSHFLTLRLSNEEYRRRFLD